MLLLARTDRTLANFMVSAYRPVVLVLERCDESPNRATQTQCCFAQKPHRGCFCTLDWIADQEFAWQLSIQFCWEGAEATGTCTSNSAGQIMYVPLL
jgi:hypothetical protein